jgi:UDP-N-acetylmuramoylalanine--D-glutamate ligase
MMQAYGSLSRVLVVGLGRSGLAAARLAAADGAEVWVTDLRFEDELAGWLEDLPSGSRRFLGGHPVECLEGVDLVVVSPGVPPGVPILEAARAQALPITTEVEFAWRHRAEAPLVAVTGSNGKSTVTELVAQISCAAGHKTVAGGNLGTAASDLVLEGGWESWVLEISSFQAELLTAMSPTAAVFLNLSQDHLERHTDLEAYLAAKQKLFAFQGGDDVAILNADDPEVAATVTAARKRRFSTIQRADAFLDGEVLVMDGEPLVERSEIRLSGVHNLANALAAALAADALGVPAGATTRTLRNFEGLDHRHRTVHTAAGVRWVDDSKATNVGATLAALRGYPEKSVHLILGGQAKGQDFSSLADEVRRAAARLYVIGVDGPAIADALAGSAPAEISLTLEAAVSRARELATDGQWVLLAPACASFDQFADYGERGDRFSDLAREEVVPCR